MICDRIQECCAEEQFICKNKKDCLIYRDSRPQAVCEEKGKRYNLLNDKSFTIALYHMDGGMICGEGDILKCDILYVIYDHENPTSIFVELKGKDIRQAVAQLKASIDRYGSVLKRRVCARIVCGSVPRLYNDPIIKNLKKDLANQYNGSLHIFEKNREERYSDI